jgi:hypothetical protein
MSDLKEIMGENIFSKRYETAENLKNTLSRQEIEDVLIENGVSLPLDSSVEFFIIDKNDHRFRVLYSIVSDEFSYLKYKHAN